MGNKRFKAVNALERVVVEAENEVCRRKQAFGFVGEARSDYNVVGAGQKAEIFGGVSGVMTQTDLLLSAARTAASPRLEPSASPSGVLWQVMTMRLLASINFLQQKLCRHLLF